MVNITTTGLFMFGLFILGIGLMICFVNLQTSILSSCTSLKLKNYLNGVLVLSIISLTLPISYMLCNSKCSKQRVSVESKFSSFMYIFIVFALGVTIITLGVFIKNELSNINCNQNNNFADGAMIGLGSIYLFIGLVMSWLLFKK